MTRRTAAPAASIRLLIVVVMIVMVLASPLPAAADVAPAASPERNEKLEAVLSSLRGKRFATLDDVFQLALQASETLAIAGERRQQAESRASAGKSVLLPSISVQGTEFRQNDVAVAGTGQSLVTTSGQRREIRLRLDQAITRFGAEFAGIRELQRRSEAAAANLEDELRLFYRSLAQSMAAVLFREREVMVRAETVESAEERLREMDARREVGLARRAELLRIRAQLSADRAALEEARGALALLREDLALLIGLPVEVALAPDLGLAPDELPPGNLDTDSLLAAAEMNEAIERRPDVAAARLAAEADRLHAGVVRGEFFPRIDLGGNYYLYRQGFSTFQQETDWDATLTLSVSLWSGGASRARLAEARSRASEAKFELARVRREAVRDVRAARIALISGGARLRTLEDGLEHAAESAGLAEEEYRQGISTNLEVELARLTLREARLALERQRLELALARIDLDLALGRRPRPAAEG